MTYKLGPVKPYVAEVANSVGPKFGIAVAYGYAYRDIAGTSTLSDHALGLAVDFMTNHGTSQGNALAAYVKDNASALGVKYVIWNRRIWSVQRSAEGWRAYDGVNPHTDHVHVSFYEQKRNATNTGWVPIPGPGGIPIPIPVPGGGGIDVPNPLDAGKDAFNAVKDSLDAMARLVKFLLDPHTWIRWFMFLIGLWLIGIGIYMLIKNQGAGDAVKATGNAARSVGRAVKRTPKAASDKIKTTRLPDGDEAIKSVTRAGKTIYKNGKPT